MRFPVKFMAYNIWGFPIGEFTIALSSLNEMPHEELCRYADKLLKNDFTSRVECLGWDLEYFDDLERTFFASL